MLPFSEACERNKQPILDLLSGYFGDRRAVLEIGSGTGQHAVHFGQNLPHLTWFPSDRPGHLDGLAARIESGGLPNVRPPFALDVDHWPADLPEVDGVFTANTLHIVSWPRVVRLLTGVGAILPPKGLFCVYGPFNYDGAFTSESNASFDGWLKARDPESGIRDYEAVASIAAECRLMPVADHAMPANNRLLAFQKLAESAGAAANPRPRARARAG